MAENGLRRRAEKIYASDRQTIEYFRDPSKMLAKRVPATVLARARERKLRELPEETREKRVRLAAELREVAEEGTAKTVAKIAKLVTTDLSQYYDHLSHPDPVVRFLPWTFLNGRKSLEHLGPPVIWPLGARLTMGVVPSGQVPGLRATLADAVVDARETITLMDNLRQSIENEVKRKNPAWSNFAEVVRKRRRAYTQTARMIALHPKLRAEYFAHPDGVLARQVPAEWGPPWLWRFARQAIGTWLETLFGWVSEETIAERRDLAVEVETQINLDGRLISARETFHERETFLKEGMQNPERSFRAVFWMSVVAFLIGMSFLIVGAVFAGLGHHESAGLFGGAGLATTLTSLLKVSSGEIRKANCDHAQTRMILTDFASEIAHLRGMKIEDFRQAKERNAELRQLTKDAVTLVAAQTAAEKADGRARGLGDGRRNGRTGGSTDTAQGLLGRLVQVAGRGTRV